MATLRVRTQLYRCRACGRQSRETPPPHAYPPARRQGMLHAYQQRSRWRGLTRTFGVSGTPVSTWSKKKELNFLLSLAPESPPIQRIPLPGRWNAMSCGRLCSNKRTRPACGWPCAARDGRWWPLRLRERSKKTCQRLWEAIADNSRQGQCFTDLWAPYWAVSPEEQQTAGGKEAGETAHVERWKNTALPAPGPFCAHDVVHILPR